MSLRLNNISIILSITKKKVLFSARISCRSIYEPREITHHSHRQNWIRIFLSLLYIEQFLEQLYMYYTRMYPKHGSQLGVDSNACTIQGKFAKFWVDERESSEFLLVDCPDNRCIHRGQRRLFRCEVPVKVIGIYLGFLREKKV